MWREEKLFANATEPTRVAVLSMLRSFAMALKMVAGVTKFSKCCECAGFQSFVFPLSPFALMKA